MADSTSPSSGLAEYRKWLVSAEQKSQEDFDKTVLSLSGGALGISLAFLKDVIGTNPIAHPALLLAAWLAWAFSTFAVLTSYYLSHLALRRAISQVDDGSIYMQPAGGSFSRATAILNAAGGLLFLIGVCCITAFAGFNFVTKGPTNDRQETVHSLSSPSSAAATTKITPSDAGTGQSAAVQGRVHSPATAPRTVEETER